MFGLGKQAKSVTYGAIIDVGSGSVGVGILASDYNKKLPEIIFSHRVAMRVATNETKNEDHLRRMREALFSASLILSKQGLSALHERDKKARISRILVTCSSPWGYTVSKNISYTHDTELKVTESFIQDLVESVEKEIEGSVRELESEGFTQFVIVERATVDLKVNGYAIDNPLDQKGLEFELSHIVGLVPQDILDAVYEVQSKVLTDTKISAHTYMLISYCVLRDLFPKVTSLGIIDVTGESTELGLVQNGVLTVSVHSPSGYNTLIRSIEKKTKGSYEDIVSSLRLLGESTTQLADHTDTSIDLEEYTDALRSTLKKLHTTQSIPRTLVITAPPHLNAFFTTLIQSIFTDVTNDTYTALEMQGKILDEVALRENRDVFVAIAARFFHKLHGCGEIDTL